MKNKWYLCAVILIFFAAAGFGDDKTNRIGEGYGGYWLNGFPFETYKPETEGLQPRIKAEAAYIKAKETQRTPAPAGKLNTYVITGHSQGGLRALALGGYLKANDSNMYNKLDGIITISGIDRGLKALEGGVGVLTGKIQDDINIVWGGNAGYFESICASRYSQAISWRTGFWPWYKTDSQVYTGRFSILLC